MNLPIKALTFISHMPFVGSPKLQEKAKNMDFISNRLDGMLGLFKFFMDGTWIFESQKILNLLQQVSPEERVEFQCDVREIDFY
jgi:hypothetical protein